MAFNLFKKKGLTSQKGLSEYQGGPIMRRFRRSMRDATSGDLTHATDPLDLYENAPWARALTDKLADAVTTSLMTMKLYEENALYTQEGQAKEPITKHKFIDFLKYGCQEMSMYSAIHLTYRYRHVEGGAAWRIRKNGRGTPYRYEVISISWLKQVPGANNSFTYRIDYPYHSQPEYDVDPYEIVFFYKHNLENPLDPSGTSILGSLSIEFDTDYEASKALQNMYKNNLSLSMIVSVEEADEDEIDAISDVLRGKAGANNWGSMYVVGGKVRAEQLKHDLGQMPIVDHRRFSRETAIQVHGIPLEMLGISDNSNRATIEGAEYIFYRSTIIPELNFFVSELQRCVLWDMFKAKDLVIKYDNPLPDNQENKRILMTALPKQFRKNEVRAAGGEPPVSDEEGGSDFLEDPKEPSATTEDGIKFGLAEDMRGEKGLIVAKKKGLGDDEITAILERVRFEDFLDEDQIRIVFLEFVSEFGEDVVKEVFEQLNVKYSFDMHTREAARFVNERGLNVTDAYSLHIKENIRPIIVESIGSTIDKNELRKVLRERFGNMTDWKARQIAQTETQKAHGFARLESAKQSSVLKWKQWVHQTASNFRDNHKAMHNQVVRINENFTAPSFQHGRKTIPEDFAPGPGLFTFPQNVINCNCEVLFFARKPGEKKGAIKPAGIKGGVSPEELVEKYAIVEKILLKASDDYLNAIIKELES